MKTVILGSGGTALGPLCWHTYDQIVKRDGLPSAVAGTSVNAVMLPLVAQGRLADLRALCEAIDGTGFFQAPNLPDIWHGLFHFRPLTRKLIENLPRGRYKIPCFVWTTEMREGRHHAERIDDLPLPEQISWILASATQPLVHEPQKMLPTHADGGVSSVLGRLPPGFEDAERVHAVFASPLTRKPRKVEDAVGMGRRAVELWIDRVVQDDLAYLRGLAAEGREVWIYDHPDPGAPFDASPKVIRWRLDVAGVAMWEGRRRVTP